MPQTERARKANDLPCTRRQSPKSSREQVAQARVSAIDPSNRMCRAVRAVEPDRSTSITTVPSSVAASRAAKPLTRRRRSCCRPQNASSPHFRGPPSRALPHSPSHGRPTVSPARRRR
eukprot:5380086-Prymnesium_polylepis.1